MFLIQPESPQPDLGSAQQLEAAIATLAGLLKSLGATVGWPNNYLAGAKFVEVGARVRGLVDNLRQALNGRRSGLYVLEPRRA